MVLRRTRNAIPQGSLGSIPSPGVKPTYSERSTPYLNL